jgi:uncharacterized membrane protein
MIAGFDSKRLAVEITGVKVSVPDNPYIRLCYYLACVKSTDLPESIPGWISDWEDITVWQKKDLSDFLFILELADRYSPKKVQETGFFVMVPTGTLNDSNNEFIKITATSTQIGLLAGNNAALALVKNSCQSVKLMLYEKSWEDQNFYIPLQATKDVVERAVHQQESARPRYKRKKHRKCTCS